MNQKQITLAVSALVIVALGIFVIFSFYNSEEVTPGNTNTNTTERKTGESAEPVPESVDGITAEIMMEAETDQQALAEEQAGENTAINEDSQSVNDLGNSYDENSY